MIKLCFVSHDGEKHFVDAQPGVSIMEAAVKNGVPGIIGECGGYCACGTCLAWIDVEYLGLTGTAQEAESDMMEFLENEDNDARLTCQIKVTEEMDGIVIKTPRR